MPHDPVAAAPSKEQPAPETQTAPAFPHPDAAKKAEDAANKSSVQVTTKALSVRQWLESAVVPVVRCQKPAGTIHVDFMPLTIDLFNRCRFIKEWLQQQGNAQMIRSVRH